ncbi:MAG: hypothetical protein AAF206_22535 [Bacteroidota bacterium]
MKRLTFIFGLLALFASACSSVEFASPQPLGVKSQQKFPKSMRGIYVEGHDTLVIGKRRYAMTEDMGERNSLPSGAKSNMITEGMPSERLLRTRNLEAYIDYAAQVSNQKRYTVHGLSDSIYLKKWKGMHVLNWQSKHGWVPALMIMGPDGHLVVRMIDTDEDLEALRANTDQLTEVLKEDGKKVDHYIADPEADELLGFIRDGGFSEELFRMRKLER